MQRNTCFWARSSTINHQKVRKNGQRSKENPIDSITYGVQLFQRQNDLSNIDPHLIFREMLSLIQVGE